MKWVSTAGIAGRGMGQLVLATGRARVHSIAQVPSHKAGTPTSGHLPQSPCYPTEEMTAMRNFLQSNLHDGYNLFTNNCNQLVSDALYAASGFAYLPQNALGHNPSWYPAQSHDHWLGMVGYGLVGVNF